MEEGNTFSSNEDEPRWTVKRLMRKRFLMGKPEAEYYVLWLDDDGIWKENWVPRSDFVSEDPARCEVAKFDRLWEIYLKRLALGIKVKPEIIDLTGDDDDKKKKAKYGHDDDRRGKMKERQRKKKNNGEKKRIPLIDLVEDDDKKKNAKLVIKKEIKKESSHEIEAGPSKQMKVEQLTTLRRSERIRIRKAKEKREKEE